MTPLEFQTQMDRLHRTYGEKAYPKERMDAVWERVRGIPAAQFEKALTHLIGENFTPPSLSKITDALALFRTSDGALIHYATPAYSCEACEDRGFGFVGDTAVKCVCPRGDRMNPEEVLRHQRSYDKGKKFLRSPSQFVGFRELPYDPTKREGA